MSLSCSISLSDSRSLSMTLLTQPSANPCIRVPSPYLCDRDMFGANRGPIPSVDGLVSVDGLEMAGHPRIGWPGLPH